MGYLKNGPVLDGLIDVENLTLVLLYDEQLRPGLCALRLAGFSGKRVPWGVRFGGPERCRFIKDLRLQPVPGGPGYRVDLADTELLSLGLALERELGRHARYRQQHVREQVRLPKLWAGFRPADAANISGDGPELIAYAAHSGRSREDVLEHLRREHLDLTVYPAAWVSHHWQQAVAVFADLARFPSRQIFRLRQPDDLVGYRDAAEFNFRSCHRSSPRQRRRRSPRAAATLT